VRPSAPPLGLIAAALIGVVTGLWTWTLPGRTAVPEEAAAAEALVLNNGFHTDLALPRAALEGRPGPLGETVRALPPGDWILIGWGDARFYVDQSPIEDRLLDGVRAFFRPGNASVLMLDPHVGDPRARVRDDRVRALPLTAGDLDALGARIEGSLDLGRGGAPRLAAARPGDDARFFAARGRFWILNLCNNWTARTLNAAGLPVRPLRSVTAGEVMAAIDRARPDAELDTAVPQA
jgi:uncharacterized protein (TIGR02117 family)